MQETLPGSYMRNLTVDGDLVSPYFPEQQCVDVIIALSNLNISFVTVQNYQFSLNQNLFRQGGTDSLDCYSLLAFQFNATRDLIILGQASIANFNITVDFEDGLIGLTGGVNLTVVNRDYSGRATILVVVFSIIAILAILINFTLDRSRKELATAQKLLKE